MTRILLIISTLFLLSCDLGQLSLNSNQGLDVVVPTPDVEPPNEIEEPVEPPARSIEEQYPFLKEQSFWDRVEEITPIPSSKSCSNQKSYAYFGIVRLVNSYLSEAGFPMFPFEEDIRYYRFLDRKEPEDPKRWEIFGLDRLFENLLLVDKQMRSSIGRSLTLTGITKHHDFDHDLHCRHRAGNVFDLRPFPGDQAVTWRSKEYNREMNLKFIKTLLAWEKVELIFFNDPQILNNKEVKEIIAQRATTNRPVRFQSARGHDNHLHVEFYIDGELDRISTYVFQKTNYALMKFNAEDEYKNH